MVSDLVIDQEGCFFVWLMGGLVHLAVLVLFFILSVSLSCGNLILLNSTFCFG